MRQLKLIQDRPGNTLDIIYINCFIRNIFIMLTVPPAGWSVCWMFHARLVLTYWFVVFSPILWIFFVVFPLPSVAIIWSKWSVVKDERWKMHNRLVLPHASPKKKPHVSLYAVFVLSNSLKLQAQLLRALCNDCTISGLPSLQSKLETYEGVTELLGKVAHWKFFTFQSGVSIRGSGHILLSSLWFPQDNWVHNVFGKINVKTSCLFILNSRLHWYCSCLE